MAHDRKALQMVAKTAHNIMALLAVHSQTMAFASPLLMHRADPSHARDTDDCSQPNTIPVSPSNKCSQVSLLL